MQLAFAAAAHRFEQQQWSIFPSTEQVKKTLSNSKPMINSILSQKIIVGVI